MTKRRKLRSKQRFDALYERGWSRGLTPYRYGVLKIGNVEHDLKSRITLACTAPPARIFRGKKREEVLDRILDTLRDWRTTPFENEGAVHAGLRSALCLQGFGWARSDLQVADLIAEAYRVLGAKRPTWEEGQRGYPLECDFCSWCFRRIDDDDRSRGRRFCSVECARVALQHMDRKTNHHYGAVLRSAIRLLEKEKAEPRQCEYCSRSFKTDHTNGRFCSLKCAGLHMAGDSVLSQRHCQFCAVIYKPITQTQRFCSLSCSRRSNLRAEADRLADVIRQCTCCGTSFTPKTGNTIYCSHACYKRANGATYRERRRQEVPEVACNWCGDKFQPTIKGALFCSTRCNKDASRNRVGWIPRDLSRRAFDRFIALPWVVQYDRRLTPQKLDWFMMEQGLRLTGTDPTRAAT